MKATFRSKGKLWGRAPYLTKRTRTIALADSRRWQFHEVEMDWTEEDKKRAFEEGWTYLHGYVRSTYDHRGIPRFNNHHSVIAHLREMARTSEWHKRVYLNLPWTIADNHLARQENWVIDLNTGNVLTTFRCIDESLEQANEKAQEHVLKKAQQGDPLHIKALTLSAKKKLLRG